MSGQEEKKQDPRTVFVRGVDNSIDDAKLQECFDKVGPVKKAFLVRKGKDGPHRGFGFVQFAVQEDAVRAAAELNGTELAGRKLKVEGAVRRAPLEERKKRKQDAAAAPPADKPTGEQPAAAAAAAAEPAAKKPRPARQPRQQDSAAVAAAGAKHKWLRTVAVGGLSPEAVAGALQMVRAAGEVEEVIQPVPDKLAAHFMLRRDGCSGESFLAVYKNIKQASAAVARLHGQTVGGQQQQQGKKGQVAAAPAGSRLWARQLSGEGLHQKRWRLIVRNLPFNATEADLRTAFSPAGFVWELTLPLSASGRGRGFAFVGFTQKTHAERGIKLVNGQTVAGRPVAVDWAVAKAQYGGQQQQAAEAAEAAAAEAAAKGKAQQPGMDSDLDGSSDDEGGHAGMGHESEDEAVAAGGGAVAPEQERRMLSSVIDGILGDSDDEAAEEEGSEEDDDEEGSEEEGSEEEGSASEGEEEEEEAEEEAAAYPAAADPFSRKHLQQKAAAAAGADAAAAQQQLRQRAEPEAGATVFIRGLPLDVSKEQVFQKMKTYGPVRSCRLVVDKDSGKLKGTAFVDFYKMASAHEAAEACAKGRRKEGPGVLIAGLVAEVDMALGHDDVRALATQKAAERGPRDSRRLALAKEGQIAEGSPAWEDMPAGDRAKRKRAAEEKKLKLKSPNFLVSDTRLSVRNLPHSWTEKQLKQCFIAAVKARATKAQPVIHQAKILLDEERPGPDGAPRSKGIGFVEFSEHEHALCALRQLNNNPTAFSKERRPIVEFALENVKALKLREAKLAKSKLQQQQRPAQGDAEQQQQGAAGGAQQGARPGRQQEAQQEDEEMTAAEKSKRQLRRERRLMLKERRANKQQRQEQREAAANGGGSGGGEEGPSSPAGGPAEADKSKAAKRRELRKKRKLEAAGLEPAEAAEAVKAASKPAAAKPAAAKPAAAAPKASAAGAKQQKQQQPQKQQPQRQQPPQNQQKPQQKQQKPQQERPQQKQQERPRANSQVARASAASQQEQQAQRRKRSADDLIDRLAGPAPVGAVQQKKRKKEETDNVDALAKQYLQKYFDAPAGGAKGGKGGKAGGTKAAAPKPAAALRRWFD